MTTGIGNRTNEGGTMGLDQLRFKARKQVEEAIKLIPMERKAAFLEAVEKAPHLVQTESDPLKFLRRCDYNIGDASDRLCFYWKERKSLFGPERAFLPLVLTGDGALTKNDILSLQAGYPAVLPRSQTTGKQVVYCDRRQFVPGVTAANKRRCIFYIFHILAEDERAQTEGVLVFTLLVSPRLQEMDIEYAESAMSLAIHAAPVKFQFHLMNVLPKGAQRKLYEIQEMISFNANNCFTLGVKQRDLGVHIEREKGDLCELLQEEFGLTRAGIPTALGGTWAFAESASWCRNRANMERKQFKWLKKRTSNSSPAAAAPCGNVCTKQDTTTSLSAKKRAANVIHSRRKRERRRHEWALLTSEQDDLQQEQSLLKKENARLEDLLRQAQSVLLVDETPSRLDRSRAPGQQRIEGALSNAGSGWDTPEDHNDCARAPKKMKVDEATTVGMLARSPEIMPIDDHDHPSRHSGEEDTKQRKVVPEQQLNSILKQDQEACRGNDDRQQQVQRHQLVVSPSFTAKKRTFSQIAAEAVCCSPDEQKALIQVLLMAQQKPTQKT